MPLPFPWPEWNDSPLGDDARPARMLSPMDRVVGARAAPLLLLVLAAACGRAAPAPRPAASQPVHDTRPALRGTLLDDEERPLAGAVIRAQPLPAIPGLA